jgi:hypothetical protein
MKKILIGTVVAFVAALGIAFAEPDEVIAKFVMTTNTITQTSRVKGKLNHVVAKIDSGNSSTCVLSAVTSQGDILYTNSFTSAQTVYLPMQYAVYDRTGTAITNFNGAIYEQKVILDDVTFRCSGLVTGGKGTNSIIFYLER